MTIRLLADRVWVYNDPGDWDWPRLHFVTTGLDEYGRKTIVGRLPGRRALVWAWWTCRCADCDVMRRKTFQWEDDVRKIADVYGITEDAVIDLPDEAWDRALAAHREADWIEKFTGRTVPRWERSILARLAYRVPKEGDDA